MVKVSIRVRNGAACFDVAVQAESVERAINLVLGRYSSGDVRVKLLSGPDVLSIGDRGSLARIAGWVSPDEMAA